MTIETTIARLERLAPAFADERDKEALLTAVQALKRTSAAQASEFSVTVIVSQRTGLGMLDVVWGERLIQIDATKAREIAWILLESASTAEAEATLCAFLQEELKATPQHAAVMLQAFREHRAKRPTGSLLADPKDRLQ
jgi:hypothetical protein